MDFDEKDADIILLLLVVSGKYSTYKRDGS